MAFTLSRVSASTVAFWITTTIAITSLGTLAAMTISLGINNTQSDTNIYDVTLAAAALDILGLVSTLIAASLFLLRVTRRTKLLCCAGFAMLAIVAAVVTIYSLAELWNMDHESTEDDQIDSTAIVITQAGFAIWAVATFSQIVMYAIILWPYKEDHSDFTARELAARLEQVRTPKRSNSVQLNSLSSPRSSPLDQTMTDPTASHFSTPSVSPRSSFRQSVTQAIRPMTSKTRLLFQSSIISRDSPSLYQSRDTSIESPRTPRTQNEFRDWDTSGAIIPEERPQTPINHSRSTRTRLEPIPGSRPVSPAKPLDGPFESDTPEDMPLPDSPMASPGFMQSDFGSIRARPRAVSRPQSNHSQEAHIHPLFRSESPNPPPITSPGTIITASPYAGQVVNPDQSYFPPPRFLRSAQGSRPSSPSPLSPAAAPLSRSRQSSFRSLRVQQSSPVDVRSASTLPWEAEKEG